MRRHHGRFYQKGLLYYRRAEDEPHSYPCGMKQKISGFALHLRKTGSDVITVTAGRGDYYVYRYEGNLNGIDKVVVLVRYPTDASHVPGVLRAFISTDVA